MKLFLIDKESWSQRKQI